MKKRTEKISDVLRNAYNLDISKFDDSFLDKIIDNRLAKSGFKSVEEYSCLLELNKLEADSFVDSLSINYSEFFRNPITFAYIEQLILPQLADRKVKNGEKEIRIWSAACASGQEPYSISILCNELKEAGNKDLMTLIFGTDNNKEELRKAQAGVYSPASLARVGLKFAGKYFSKSGDSYSVLPSVSENVLFSHFDLFSETDTCPPISIYGNFDIVFCCNLLFYYNKESRSLIMDKLNKSVTKEGYLVTGESERNFLMKNNYHEVFPASAIFQRNNY